LTTPRYRHTPLQRTTPGPIFKYKKPK
jgi:hypothetical protein